MANDFEITDEVNAETVEINQGGAGVVQATTVNVTQGGIQTAATEALTVTQGGVMMVETTDASFSMAGAGVVSADNVDLHSAGAGVAIADTVKADESSTIGVLFAGSVEGSPTVHVDARSTIVALAAVAGVAMVLKRLLRRS